MAPDPLTVLGLAGNILQFLDFTTKLVAGTRAISSSLSGVSEESAYLRQKATAAITLIDGFLPSDANSTELHNVLEGCKNVAETLLEALDKLEVKGPKGKWRLWRSFKSALREIWSQNKIDAVSARLTELQIQISAHVQVQMKNEIAAVSDAIQKLELNSSQLELKCEENLTSLEKNIVSAMASLAPPPAAESSKVDKPPTKFKQLATHPTIDWRDPGKVCEALPSFEAIISNADAKLTDLYNYQSLLGSLYFTSITTRLETIPHAHHDTFTWIFKGETPDGSQQIRFGEWLRTQNGHFWIRGKAGSGKSTLMKYLTHHPQTRQNLEIWANDRPLVFAVFFFWNSGTSLQKSQEGLLRSLLFAVLRQCPELVPRVCESLARGPKAFLFENRWTTLDHLSRDDIWSMDELMSVYKALTAEETSSKFCFLIDGLDEFHIQDHKTHGELINTIKNLTVSSNVKVCLSSRPWTQFKDAFGADPQIVLKLEDLTRQDIERYVSDKLHEHEQYHKLKEIDPCYAGLVDEVVQKAQGVFLWVILVVRDLLEGITYNDSIKTMRARLESLPEDLEGFFSHMLQAVPKIYQGQTARSFQVALSVDHPLLLMTYAFLDDVEEDHKLSSQQREPYTDANVQSKKDMMQRRLDGRTRGLLEIHRSRSPESFFQYKVDFLHRTVRDFLQYSPDTSVIISQNVEHQNETWMLLCHATVLVLKQAPVADTPKMNESRISTILHELCFFASQSLKCPENLRAVNALFSDSISPLSRTMGMIWPVALENMFEQAAKYGLVHQRRERDKYLLNEFKVRFRLSGDNGEEMEKGQSKKSKRRNVKGSKGAKELPT